MEPERRAWPILVFALVLPTLVTWAYFVALADSAPWMQQGAYAIGKVVQFGLPAVAAFWLLPRKLGFEKPSWPGVGLGLAFGLLIGGAMLGLYHVWFKHLPFFTGPEEAIRAKIAGLGIDSAWKFAALGVFYALCHSLMEEYYWRWFVFHELKPRTPLPAAIAISSFGFMAHHVIVLWMYFGPAWPTWLFSLSIAIGGAVWAWLYHTSKSIVGPWLSHLLVDAAIFLIGYDIAFGGGSG